MHRPWLLLDLAGVLLQVRPNRCVLKLAALSGLDVAAVRARLSDTGIADRLERGLAGTAELAAILSDIAGSPVAPDDAWALWLRPYAPDLHMVLALPALARTHRLGVFSNDPPAVTGVFDAALFERLFFSAELGARKPEPDSFRIVARLLEAPPDDIGLVDDDPVHVEAAREAGWRAVLFTGVDDVAAAVAAAWGLDDAAVDTATGAGTVAAS